MVKQEADILTRVAELERAKIIFELAHEQHGDNIKDLDLRVIKHDTRWRAAKPILNSLAHCKMERWIAIAITVLNLLLLLLK